MYDHIGTTKITTPIVAGTIVRNDGYGSRLMRVVEVVKDSVLLESYGLLNYGDIVYPKSPRRIVGKIFPMYGGGEYINSRNNRDRHGGSYTPVDIVSRMKPNPCGLEHSKYGEWLEQQMPYDAALMDPEANR